MPVFDGATTYPCIIRIGKGSTSPKFSAAQIKTLKFSSLADYTKAHSFKISKSSLSDKGWSLVDESVQKLLTKLKKAGKPEKKTVEEVTNIDLQPYLNSNNERNPVIEELGEIRKAIEGIKKI